MMRQHQITVSFVRAGLRASLAVLMVCAVAAAMLSEAYADTKIVRLGDSGQQAGEASNISIAGDKQLLLTTVRQADGRLKVILWRVSEDGLTVTRKGSAGGGIVRATATSYGIVPTVGRVFYTALRTENDRLKVIAWRIVNDTPERFGELELDDEVARCDIAGLPPVYVEGTGNSAGRFVTLCQSFSNTLLLRLFEIAPNGYISQGAVTVLPNGTRPQVAYSHSHNQGYHAIVTTFRNAAGNLQLRLYDVTSPGVYQPAQWLFRHEAFAGATSDVALAPGRVDSEYGVATAVKTGSGLLKTIFWKILPDPGSSELHDRRLDRDDGVYGSTGNQAGEADVVSVPGNRYVVGWREAGTGALRLDAYNTNGGTLATASAGTIKDLAMEHDGSMVFTAVETGSGQLKLIVWRLDAFLYGLEPVPVPFPISRQP